MNRLGKSIAVASLLALSVPLGAAAQSMASLAGTYSVVVADAFGKSPRGTLMLGADGRYSIMVMRSALPKFASGARTKGTADENKSVVEGSIAHYGRYTIDDGGKTLTFHIEAATFSNWDGQTQKRPLRVKGDEIIYTVPVPSTGGPATDLVWRRVR